MEKCLRCSGTILGRRSSRLVFTFRSRTTFAVDGGVAVAKRAPSLHNGGKGTVRPTRRRSCQNAPSGAEWVVLLRLHRLRRRRHARRAGGPGALARDREARGRRNVLQGTPRGLGE